MQGKGSQERNREGDVGKWVSLSLSASEEAVKQ